MKNKELVKQLEGVGFVSKVSRGIRITLEVKGGYAFDYYEGDDRVHFYKYNEPVAASIHCPTFAQIAAKVKEITGVDLTKKTKREEIEELKVRLGKMEDAIKNMQGMCDKQSSEMQAEEAKGIEVGDRVDFGLSSSKTAITVICNQEGSLFAKKITESEIESREKTKDNQVLRKIYEQGKLEHAPKESPKEKALEFGDPLECNVKYDGLLQGEKVIFLSKTKNGNYNVINKHSNHYCLGSIYFKAL